MNREKQNTEIDELTTVLYEANHKKSVLDYHFLATEAYNAGYRKQNAVIDEFAERLKKEMENLTRMVYSDKTIYLVDKSLIDRIAEEMKGGAE